MNLPQWAINWVVWDCRRRVLENQAEWESRAWPFSLCQLFLFRRELVVLCAPATYSKAVCTRGKLGQAPWRLACLLGTLRIPSCAADATGEPGTAAGSELFLFLLHWNRSKAVSFWRWEFLAGPGFISWHFLLMSDFWCRTRTCSGSCSFWTSPLSEVFVLAFNGAKSECRNTGPAEVTVTQWKGRYCDCTCDLVT